MFARGALKKLWRPNLTEAEAVAVAVEALYDAADDDSATGGPDLARQLWPVVYIGQQRVAPGASRAGARGVAGAIIESRAAARREA